jgi:hypothetical protein
MTFEVTFRLVLIIILILPRRYDTISVEMIKF